MSDRDSSDAPRARDDASESEPEVESDSKSAPEVESDSGHEPASGSDSAADAASVVASSKTWRQKWSARLDALRARIIVPLLILAAAYYFATTVHGHYPLEKWLFWRYAGYWLACAYFSLACVSLGHLTIKKLLRRTLPMVEHLATCFAVGVFEFFLAMFVLGALDLYQTATFFLLPLAFIIAGGPQLLRYLRRMRRNLRRQPRKPRPAWHYAVILFGVFGLAMIYFVILAPDHVQFDARWKHLALAEEYAVHGGIRRFNEGWTVATYPHLVSFLFTWGFLVPGGELFDQVEMCAHLEFVCFLWTLAAIPAAVRMVVPRTHAHLAWTARFLFPGIFLYDSSLAAGADHVGALFAIPIFTLLYRAWRKLEPGYCALLALVMSGGALIKYTATMMYLPIPAFAIVARGIFLSRRRKSAHAHERNYWFVGPLTTMFVGLVVTAPHWLKNIIWYGDPIYPMLYSRLPLRPWIGQDGADMFEWGYKEHQFWRPSHDWEGFKKTLQALFNFSFIPNDYKRYHGKVPVFGSLFTLLVLVLPVLRARPFFKQRWRLWALVLTTHASLFIWYWTHHQDRYLQSLAPWMAVVTAACIVIIWRTHLFARIALVGLIALQVIWGGDVYFIQSHAMIKSPIKRVNDLLQMGYKRQYERRFGVLGSWRKLRTMLPRGSRLVLHDNHTHTGVGHTTINDWQGWQYGINYGRLPDDKAMHELYVELGATHIVWKQSVSKGWDSLAGDIMFFHYATQRTVNKKRIGSLHVAEIPKEAPTEPFDDRVAIFGCRGRYGTGLYRVKDLTVPVFGPRRRKFPKARVKFGRSKSERSDMVKQAAFVAVAKNCKVGLGHTTEANQFKQVAKRRRTKDRRRFGKKRMDIFVRIKGKAEPSPKLR